MMKKYYLLLLLTALINACSTVEPLEQTEKENNFTDEMMLDLQQQENWVRQENTRP